MLRLLPVLVWAALVGCSALMSEPSCGRSRRVAAFDTLPDISYQLTLLDQDPDEGNTYAFRQADFVDWSVTVPRKAVTAVHLHLRDDGRLLWDLTTRPPITDPAYTVANSMEYSPTTDIGNLFGLVRDGRTYIDVHTDSATEPALRTDLTRLDFTDWEPEHGCST
jgi:hypothetical protein